MAVFLLTVCRKLDTFASNMSFVNGVSIWSLLVVTEDMTSIKTLGKHLSYLFVLEVLFLLLCTHWLFSCRAFFPSREGGGFFPFFQKGAAFARPNFTLFTHPTLSRGGLSNGCSGIKYWKQHLLILTINSFLCKLWWLETTNLQFTWLEVHPTRRLCPDFSSANQKKTVMCVFPNCKCEAVRQFFLTRIFWGDWEASCWWVLFFFSVLFFSPSFLETSTTTCSDYDSSTTAGLWSAVLK